MTGIATVSEGEALNWYGSGKTELTTNSNLEVTYGVKTEVVIGFKNDFSLAAHTDISVGVKFDASLAAEMTVRKNAAVETSEDGEFYFMDSYVGTVGASAAQLAAAKTLREATTILLRAQTAAMLLATINATAVKIMSPESKEEIRDPIFNVKLGYLTSIFSIAATVAPALMVIYGKLKGLGENNNPAGVLSMDATGCVFLGTRSMAPPNATSGLLLNATKAQLSAANTDLGYNRPADGASVLGFNKAAGSGATGGSRLEVCGDGSTYIYGALLQADLTSPTGTSKHIVNAQEHHLNVTQGAAAPALDLDATGVNLKFDDKSSLSVESNSVSALAGGPAGSAMHLTASDASLGVAGNYLKLGRANLQLVFGETKISIDPTGISVGSDLSVLSPGAPGVSFSGLQQAVSDVALLNAAAAKSKVEALANQKKFEALDTTLTEVSTRLVSTRNRLKKIAARVYSPK